MKKKTKMNWNNYFGARHDEFREALEGLRGQRVAVVGHMRPDGDCIGSMVGLTRALNQSAYAIDAVAVNRDPTPRSLSAFVGDTPFYSLAEADLRDRAALAVDCADELRMSRDLRSRFSEVYLNVDHHISNPGYARHNLVDGQAAATAEILAGLFLDLALPIDAVTAQALYVGMATDTGQFRFASTTPQVFEICRRLCEKGADPALAAFELYENEPYAKLLLLQRFLASLKREAGGRVCIGELRRVDFAETGASDDDTEGLVDYARSIDGVDIGVLIEEREDGVKGSLRAKEPLYQVQQVAQLFNGGGHACAAGLNVRQPLTEFRAELTAALDRHLRNLENGKE